jgi:UDP-N-acetyl-D-glucosamine dehydrogenase
MATQLVTIPDSVSTRLERIQNRTANVGVIGLGYVGLPLSLLLAEAGFRVTGFDVDLAKVDHLQASRSYIHRIPHTEIERAC